MKQFHDLVEADESAESRNRLSDKSLTSRYSPRSEKRVRHPFVRSTYSIGSPAISK